MVFYWTAELELPPPDNLNGNVVPISCKEAAVRVDCFAWICLSNALGLSARHRSC